MRMPSLAFPRLLSGLGALALLAASPEASAITCTEIMAMVSVNVPSNIVVTTMDASGTRFSAAELKCLVDKGAPPDIIAAAARLSLDSGTPAPAPVNTPTPPPTPTPAPLDDPEMEAETVRSPTSLDSEEDDDSSGPARLNELVKFYKANKVATASKGLYDLLQSGEFPDYEDKIHYYLAKSLFDMKMYHGAQHHFMQVVRKGPNGTYFKYALPKLVAIASLTGNDTELLRVVAKIPPEAFPPRARNHLYYLMGRKEYENGELTAASRYFSQVAARSDLYMRAKYFEGVIHHERGKDKSAVKSFRDVYQAEVPETTDPLRMKEYKDLKDLALLNIGRIYYELERHEEADSFYRNVSRDGTYWAQSLFERAWAEFILTDINESLGLLLTVRSPYFGDRDFIPEADVLRALGFFNMCDWGETERLLNRYDQTYKPVREELKTFLAQYSSEEGKKLADQAYDTYFVNTHERSTLPRSIFARALRSRDLSGLVRHMDLMDQEIALIDLQKGVWKDSVGNHLKEVIEKDRMRYKQRAGQLLLQGLAEQYNVLNELQSQADIIRFEVVDAQRVDYQYKAAQPQVESADEKVIDFATSKDIIYWPFNGEFWQDELGYYKYTEKSQCK